MTMQRAWIIAPDRTVENVLEILDGATLALPPGYTLTRVEPPPPVLPSARTSTPREFMDRLSMQRQAEITAAAMQSPALLLWLIRLAGAAEVDVDNPETISAVDQMTVAGLVSSAEADILLLRA